MARPHKGQHKVPRTYLEAFTDNNGKLLSQSTALPDELIHIGEPLKLPAHADEEV